MSHTILILVPSRNTKHTSCKVKHDKSWLEWYAAAYAQILMKWDEHLESGKVEVAFLVAQRAPIGNFVERLLSACFL